MHEQHLNSLSLRLSSRWAHGQGLGYWSTVDFAWNVFRTVVDQDLAVFIHFYARYCYEEWRRHLIAPWLDHLVWIDVRVFNSGQRISSRAVSRSSRYPQGERNLTLWIPAVTVFTTRFDIQQFYVLTTHCICVFCVDLKTNSYHLPIQH